MSYLRTFALPKYLSFIGKTEKKRFAKHLVKHHNPTMPGINKKSCNLFVAGLTFYNHLTLKGSLI